VGFAAETERLLEAARDKLVRKNLDLLVANDVSQGIFGSDLSTVHVLSHTEEPVTIQNESKLEIAGKILDMAQKLLAARKE
jgi:phosphopantothenoylcysteine decarboxylase / phosphopantothenate---cysteine ligase